MKFYKPEWDKMAVGSHPARGAWIEIPPHVTIWRK